MHRNNTSAFTLIELLVVITIIVVLLALLTPALDRAIYQSELMLCAANQRGVVTGVTTYAMQHKRFYPHRRMHLSGAQYRKPNLIRAGTVAGTEADDLAVIQPYVQTKLMLDPLNGGLTVDMIDGSEPGTNINVNYMLWWDWQFTKANPSKRSSRLGQFFNMTDAWGENSDFDVLVSEEDMIQRDSRTHNSHPDSLGLQSLEVVQDAVVVPPGNQKETLSRWRNFNEARRGTFDGNYGYQDGSVSRILQIAEEDERMEKVPDKLDRSYSETLFQQIPERGRR